MTAKGSVSELRVVLLGNSWSDRTSVGNLLLGENVFTAEEEPDQCLRVKGQLSETESVVVVNTPDPVRIQPDVKLTEFVENCVRLCEPGPHMFLLVLQPEEFTEEHRLRLCRILQLFSDRSFDQSLVLVSEPRQKRPGRNYMNHPALKVMIRTCRSRYVKQEKLQQTELLTELHPGKHQGEVCGRWVSLVELPALYGEPQETVMEESFRSISLCDPEGVHVLNITNQQQIPELLKTVKMRLKASSSSSKIHFSEGQMMKIIELKSTNTDEKTSADSIFVIVNGQDELKNLFKECPDVMKPLRHEGNNTEKRNVCEKVKKEEDAGWSKKKKREKSKSLSKDERRIQIKKTKKLRQKKQREKKRGTKEKKLEGRRRNQADEEQQALDLLDLKQNLEELKTSYRELLEENRIQTMVVFVLVLISWFFIW